MEQISERWSSDMTSDSWLSKNTRPLHFIISYANDYFVCHFR